MTLMRLQEVVESSALSHEDKDLWLRTMEFMDDESASAVVESITEDPDELEVLTKNLKTKAAAFASGDHTAMEQILQSEKAELAQP